MTLSYPVTAIIATITTAPPTTLGNQWRLLILRDLEDWWDHPCENKLTLPPGNEQLDHCSCFPV